MQADLPNLDSSLRLDGVATLPPPARARCAVFVNERAAIRPAHLHRLLPSGPAEILALSSGPGRGDLCSCDWRFGGGAGGVDHDVRRGADSADIEETRGEFSAHIAGRRAKVLALGTEMHIVHSAGRYHHRTLRHVPDILLLCALSRWGTGGMVQ